MTKLLILALATSLILVPAALGSAVMPPGGGVGSDGSSDDAQAALDKSMAKWTSHNMSNYDYRYSAACPIFPCEDPLYSRSVDIRVENGTIASVELAYNWDDSQLLPEHIDAVKTPEDLFKEIQTAIDGNAETVQVQYDKNYGHPMSILIDYNANDKTDPRYSYRIETLIDLRVTESRQTELDTNLALWESHRAVDYDYFYQRSCFCMEVMRTKYEVQVRNDTVDGAFSAEDGTPAKPDMLGNWLPTIEGIFDQIQSAIDQSAYSMKIQYNDTFGYPMSVSIDYNPMMADEELYVSAEGLEILATEPVATKPVVNDFTTDTTESNQEVKSFESSAVDTSGTSTFNFSAMWAVVLSAFVVGTASSI
jgi:hypothetical protein